MNTEKDELKESISLQSIIDILKDEEKVEKKLETKELEIKGKQSTLHKRYIQQQEIIKRLKETSF